MAFSFASNVNYTLYGIIIFGKILRWVMGKLYLTCGDFILNSNNMDAIVNAQNKYMQYGSGICGAICRASGNELIEYCQNTYKEYMVNGEVRITPGFNLPMDIIHVLAPKYYEETYPY